MATGPLLRDIYGHRQYRFYSEQSGCDFYGLLVSDCEKTGDTSLSRHYKEGTFRNEVVFTLQQNVHKVLPHSFFFSPSAFVVPGHNQH